MSSKQLALYLVGAVSLIQGCKQRTAESKLQGLDYIAAEAYQPPESHIKLVKQR